MSEGFINIQDIRALDDLSNSINIFCTQNLPAMEKVEAFLFEARNQLEKYKEKLEYALEDAVRKLTNRNNMLTLCESRVEYDEKGYLKTPNCSSEEGAVRRARREQKAAQSNLSEMKELLRIVDNEIANYNEKVEKGFKKLIGNFSEHARTELADLKKIGNEYLAFQHHKSKAQKKNITVPPYTPPQYVDDGAEEAPIDPLIEQFRIPVKQLFHQSSATQALWSDTRQQAFYTRYIDVYRKVTGDYLTSTMHIIGTMHKALQAAKQLNGPFSGFGKGGLLSILDISTIVHRGISRLFYQDGWGS